MLGLFVSPVSMWIEANDGQMPVSSLISYETALVYRITPVPINDRTELTISLQFTAKDPDAIQVKLPSDVFGTPELHRHVSSVVGMDGTEIAEGKDAAERLVTPSSNLKVSLRYTLSYDPEVMASQPYGPNTGPSYFHLAGCQWMLRIGDDTEKRRIVVEIKDAPSSWKLYSSSAPNPNRFETVASYKDLAKMVIGGGDQSFSFSVNNKPVMTFVHGSFAIPAKEIASAVERIVRFERRWFSDYDQPFYHVIVAPRRGATAGYAPENAFINFVGKDISRDDLNLLLAHEMFHYWLPNKIRIGQDPKYSDIRYEWFYEGFTDYFTARVLLDAGLIDPAGFADLINKAVLNIAHNPHKAETYDQLMEASKAGRFDGVYKKLSYHRGALIALNWNTRIKSRSKNTDLADFIRALLQKARKTKGTISESEFQAFAESYGIDAKTDLDRHTMKGEPIAIDPSATIEGFRLVATEVLRFEAGFSLTETRRLKRISGVIENSEAHKAGLRNGMEFVRAENSNRFSNSWTAERPMAVIVKIDGAEHRYEYFPRGESERLMLFQRQSRIGAGGTFIGSVGHFAGRMR